MKNSLEQRPDDPLSARQHESLRLVDDGDLTGRTVLDIGCGFGWYESQLLAHAPARVIGIERTEDDLATARTYIQDSRAVFQVGNALALPFADRVFDVVVSWEVLEHLPRGQELQMFREVARVTRPGGVFCMSTPNRSLLSQLLDPAWWLIGHRHYSRADLAKLGTRAGFSVEKVSIKGRMWTLLSALNMYISKWLFRRPPLLGGFFAMRERAEYEGSQGYANIFVKFRRPKG